MASRTNLEARDEDHAPAKHENAAPHHKPWVGATVHYFDESRDAVYARMGKGPYAAIVTCLDAGGVSLFVLGPMGGRFDVEKVPHASTIDLKAPGKKRWWQWPTHG